MLLLRNLAPMRAAFSLVECSRVATMSTAACLLSAADQDGGSEQGAGTAQATAEHLTHNPKHAANVVAALQLPVQLGPSADEASASEHEFALALFRLHNSSAKFAGHMIKARVVEVDKRKITLDTGVKIAKIALSDITPECILSQALPAAGAAPRAGGEVRPGDVVQVYLEYEETPEGDMMVSGQQAAVKKRVRAVWKELETRHAEGKTVKGRILNSVAGGFAVGIAGLVGFLPGSSCSRATASRIGDLQEFKIVSISTRHNVVLKDARLVAELQHMRGFRGMRQQQRPKLPRPMVQEAEGFRKDLEQPAAPAVAAAASPAASPAVHPASDGREPGF